MTERSFVPRPAEGLNYPNVMQMFLARVRKSPEVTALRFKRGGVWRPSSWRGWELAARELAAGLITQCGVTPGDRIALMARTRVEWALCDVAIAMCGAVSVPIYSTSTGADMAYVLADSGACVLIAEHADLLRRLHDHEQEAEPGSDATARPTDLRAELLIDDAGLDELAQDRSAAGSGAWSTRERASLDDLRATGRAALAGVNEAHTRIESAIAEVGLEDVFTIVYTSGTTGRPKGVVLTHKNLVYESWAIKNSFAVDRSDLQLLMLPLAHVFARHLLWGAVASGAATAFGEGFARASHDMLEVAPTYVGAVPRFFEKVQREIEVELGSRSFVERKLVERALDVGRRVSALRQRGQAIPPVLAGQHRLADKALFESIRARFGGRLRFFVSGAAPLGEATALFFHALGVLILEGYGLTETTGATNVNRPDRYRFGTVGPSLPGCEVLIASDGEVLLRGHNIMAGYHGAHESVIDEDGWLHTGDVGEVHEGFLRITDRLKDLIITAGGKNIAPQKIEGLLRAREGVAHVMVTGDRRPYLVALVGLDEREMLAIAQRERLGCRDLADLARHPRIRDLVARYIDEINAELPRHETIKKFAIVPEPLTGATLTPTEKIKRKAVEARYAALIESLYAA